MLVVFNSSKNYYSKDGLMINNSFTKPISFGSSLPDKAESAQLILKLNKKMETRSGNVQKLYQYGIDFINKKINLENYLKKMYELLRNTKEEQWGNIDSNESRYIGDYGVFFDICGLNANKTNKSTVMDFLTDLID